MRKKNSCTNLFTYKHMNILRNTNLLLLMKMCLQKQMLKSTDNVILF